MPFQMHTLGFFCCLRRVEMKFMIKKIFITLILLLTLTQFIGRAYAVPISSASSAQIQVPQNVLIESPRVKILKSFLEKYSSPLAPFAESFIKNADKYNLDWKFVAAISGLESTFGKQIPYSSYNGWGWGVYGDNVIRFSSWDEGIETVSKGLRENYINKWGARDVYEIGRLYASSPTWAVRVDYIMDKIGEFSLSDPKNALPLSL